MKTKRIAITDLKITGWNPREFQSAPKIKASIRKRGWLDDSVLVVSLRPDTHENPGYYVLCGHRRLATLLEMAESDSEALDRALPDRSVPCVVHTDLSENDEIRLMLDHSAELDREPLDMFGQYLAFKLAYNHGVFSDGVDAEGKPSVAKTGEFLGFFNPKTGKVRTNHCQMLQRICRLPECVEREYKLLCEDKSQTHLRTKHISLLMTAFTADVNANEAFHHPQFSAAWSEIVAPRPDEKPAEPDSRPSKNVVRDTLPAIRSAAVATALRMAAGIEAYDSATIQAISDDVDDAVAFCDWLKTFDKNVWDELRGFYAAHTA